MYKNRVALSDDIKQKVVDTMENALASSLDMYSQAKFAHWNVKGMNFYQLHLVFDATAKVIFKQIDPIAARITQLGGVANGTVRQSAKYSSIPPYNTEAVARPTSPPSRTRSASTASCSATRPTPSMRLATGRPPTSSTSSSSTPKKSSTFSNPISKPATSSNRHPTTHT